MELSNTMQPNQSSYSEAHHNYADLAALGDLKRQAREDQESVLRPVAEQFEALFVQQILKEARKVSFDDNWLDGNQGDFYKDWYDKQLSLNLSTKGTLGFADKIVEQLSPSIPATLRSQVESPIKDQQVEKTAANKASPSTEQALALRFTQP
ncbi:MAG: rod-binding protein [Thiomicrorhabdus sp.]|nr:rod-binding protein [Thiomicrorhabdus sp.]